jgi:hypothetical protein
MDAADLSRRPTRGTHDRRDAFGKVADSGTLGRRALLAAADSLGAEHDCTRGHGEDAEFQASAPPATLRCRTASVAESFIRIRARGNHGKAGYSRISTTATWKRALSADRCGPEAAG